VDKDAAIYGAGFVFMAIYGVLMRRIRQYMKKDCVYGELWYTNAQDTAIYGTRFVFIATRCAAAEPRERGLLFGCTFNAILVTTAK
jgi:hypothetical protein